MNLTAAIIVAFHPKPGQLKKLVARLSSQVGKVIVVDNTPLVAGGEGVDLPSSCELIPLKENKGIAFAQNMGCTIAQKQGYHQVLLMDQDSLPAENMVEELVKCKVLVSKLGYNVAAVGAQQVDVRTGALSNFIMTKGLTVRKLNSSGTNYCFPGFLIASGCLISLDAIAVVGPMEEDFFIDCVDIEWGFRATAKGYVCVGAFDAKMVHELGEAPLTFFGHSFTYHSPLRHYYFYRNFYRLLFRGYSPLSWRLHVFIKSCFQAVIFSFFGGNKMEHMRMIMKGSS